MNSFHLFYISMLLNKMLHVFPLFKNFYMNSTKVMPENGSLSKEFLKKLLRSQFRMYYTTPELNDILYLHYKGINKIENLEEFTGLKVLYIEGNGLKEIIGLQSCTNLRCLYLQENLIKKIQNLSTLTNLVNLNLTDNIIQKIEGLAPLTNLTTILLKRNQLGRNGIEDLEGLLECQSLSCIDVQQNHIEDESFPQSILKRMGALAVLYMQNNPFTKKISHYRKQIINYIPELKYLDDKPVFQDERRFAFAWKRGGLQEQRMERQRYKEEKEQEHLRNHLAFRQMMEKAKAEREARERLQAESSQTNSQSNQRSLETYNTPQGSEEINFKESVSSKRVDSDHYGDESSECSQKNIKSVNKSQKSERSVQIYQLEQQNGQEIPDLQKVDPLSKEDIDFEQLD